MDCVLLRPAQCSSGCSGPQLCHSLSPAHPPQALLRVTLQVHGETIAEHAELRERAQRAQQRLSATWRRLDGLLQSTRCMVGFLGNLQA